MSDTKASTPAPKRIPAMGDIVLLRGHAVGEPPPPTGANPDRPAIVTFVQSPTILDLTVFSQGKPPAPWTDIPQGDAAGEWYWPPKP